MTFLTTTGFQLYSLYSVLGADDFKQIKETMSRDIRHNFLGLKLLSWAPHAQAKTVSRAFWCS